jgi:hypothetical protein
VETLEDLPKSLLWLDCSCFGDCNHLENLKGLPLQTEVHPQAFWACKKLKRRAYEFGYGSVNHWVQHRRQIPTCRAYILLCVSVAREQEDEAKLLEARKNGTEVSPLCKEIALLPEVRPTPHIPPFLVPALTFLRARSQVLVREITEFAFGDHM